MKNLWSLRNKQAIIAIRLLYKMMSQLIALTPLPDTHDIKPDPHTTEMTYKRIIATINTNTTTFLNSFICPYTIKDWNGLRENGLNRSELSRFSRELQQTTPSFCFHPLPPFFPLFPQQTNTQTHT